MKGYMHIKQQPEKTKSLVSVEQFVLIQSNNYQAGRMHQSKKKVDTYHYTSIYQTPTRTNKCAEQKPNL